MTCNFFGAPEDFARSQLLNTIRKDIQGSLINMALSDFYEPLMIEQI
jgi:hypothetical protein